MRNYIKKLNSFDPVTWFRLVNLFLITVCIGITAPLIISLKGIYMTLWIITAFSIAATFAKKANKRLINKTMSELYRMLTIANLGIQFFLAMYFVDPIWGPEIAVYGISLMGLFEIMIVTAYGIQLNNWIATKYPSSMKDFGVMKADLSANGQLVAMGLAGGLSFIGSDAIVAAALAIYTMVNIWYIYNWSFLKNIEEDKMYVNNNI
jgi:hypothetical protein